MDGKSTSILTTVVLKAADFVLGYISRLPLTYIVLYCFTMIMVLVAGSSAEAVFIKILLFALGIKDGEVTLGGQDIIQGFLFWALVIEIVFRVLKRIIHVDLGRGVLILLSLIPVVGTVALVIKTGAITVPIILLFLYVVSLGGYYSLTRGFSKIKSLYILKE